MKHCPLDDFWLEIRQEKLDCQFIRSARKGKFGFLYNNMDESSVNRIRWVVDDERFTKKKEVAKLLYSVRNKAR